MESESESQTENPYRPSGEPALANPAGNQEVSLFPFFLIQFLCFLLVACILVFVAPWVNNLLQEFGIETPGLYNLTLAATVHSTLVLVALVLWIFISLPIDRWLTKQSAKPAKRFRSWIVGMWLVGSVLLLVSLILPLGSLILGLTKP